MINKNLFGWASNFLNWIVFIYIILNTTVQCFSKSQMGLTAFGLIVSILAQINSGISEEE
jgi:hypothetical protein